MRPSGNKDNYRNFSLVKLCEQFVDLYKEEKANECRNVPEDVIFLIVFVN